jgi:triosephosphate isomerase
MTNAIDINDVNNWIIEFLKNKEKWQNINNKTIVICPSFPFLLSFNSAFNGTNIKIGVQNVSTYDNGAYTGEVSATQVKGICEYVLVGHSERRKYFLENDDLLMKKNNQVLVNGLNPIYLVQDENTLIPQGVKIVVIQILLKTLI